MIFYFSGTGNTKYLAERIGEKLGEPIISIADALKSDKTDFTAEKGKSIGFVIPVYFSGVPKCVREFIGKMNLSFGGDNYIFTALSCGGNTANAGKMLHKLLIEKGVTVNASYSAVMVDNYIPMYNIQTQQEADKMLLEINPKIELLADKIARKKTATLTITRAPKL